MDITYITRFDSLDIKNWSGTDYYVAKYLEKNNDLNYIYNFDDILDLKTKINNKIATFLGQKYFVNRSPYVAKNYAKQIEARLKERVDIIFSPSTIPIAYLETNKPKVFYTDATFASMIDYYDWFTGLSKQAIKEGLALDKLALETSAIAFYSSDWAAKSAIENFGIDSSKVKVVPLGANIETHYSYHDIESCIFSRDKKTCKLLFMGVDWTRKGGNIVLETAKYLNRIGLKTELHLMGVDCSIGSDYPFVINHGFISKTTVEGKKRIEQIFRESHFFFMPSRAEAYGIVFCEAAAFGVPSIGTNTGGIPTIIKENINGMIFELDSEAKEYASFIYNTFSDNQRYVDLAKSSYNEYVKRLNWDVASDTLINYMKEL